MKQGSPLSAYKSYTALQLARYVSVYHVEEPIGTVFNVIHKREQLPEECHAAFNETGEFVRYRVAGVRAFVMVTDFWTNHKLASAPDDQAEQELEAEQAAQAQLDLSDADEVRLNNAASYLNTNDHVTCEHLKIRRRWTATINLVSKKNPSRVYDRRPTAS